MNRHLTIHRACVAVPDLLSYDLNAFSVHGSRVRTRLPWRMANIPKEWGGLFRPCCTQVLETATLKGIFMNVTPVGDIICAKQAAALLGCSPWTLYEHCKARAIPHIRVGRLLRFRRSTIDAWLAEREAESISAQP